MKKQQPSEEVELANACYLHRKKLQADMATMLIDPRASRDDVEYHYARLINAFRREAKWQAQAKES